MPEPSSGNVDPMRSLSSLKLCLLAGTLEHGGAERQLFYVLKTLRQAGAVPRLLSLDHGEFWEERIKALGVPITCVGAQPSRLQRLARIWKAVRADPPDLLQSQHFHANAYVGLAARLTQISGIGAMRNNGSTEAAGCGVLGGWMNLHFPRTIAANSRVAIDYAVSRGISRSRLHFLPNVVDTDWFKPSGNEDTTSPLTLVAVGRLVKQKRLDRFVALVGRLRTEYGLNVRGMVVGPGCHNEDLRPELESQAWGLGLFPGALEFRGAVSDMRAVYHRAAVCVLTSDHEGTPNVLLEAMASGLPVVATRVGGVPEVVRSGETGFLTAPDDLAGMAKATADLVKNAGLRTIMGQRAREYVEEKHSVHRLPVYLADLYRMALPAHRRVVAAAVPSAAH